ncbi:hypothetical protein [Streptomyces regalis]|uniref:Uncharacterized protein n=1 Tax=Streptomyces regalis TaxID=68262 RepID=A0A0X3UUD8_9ACTN|nr:hypothetical protein [Streptomyces regalis]KUL36203.1 hypothetical protein ADL12_19555 [Streptomyces regalis]
MLRHAIAPARHFSQVPNDIIRHPRLSSDAVRLLTWQLSLPAEARDSLSRTAERAGIGKCAFLRAKRELKAEGYLHEWREQGVRGLWATVQLVSNVPLTGEEAAGVREGEEAAPAPVGGSPAAGEPKGRAVGCHPEAPVRENTPLYPAGTASVGSGDSSDFERLALARQVVESLSDLDPRLRMPRGMLPQLAALAGEWLARGHTAAAVRECVRRALPGRGQVIRRPGGLVRYVLSEVPPPPLTPAVAAPENAAPQLPRVAQMRECEGRHTQPLLFRPVADERLCRACRSARAAVGEGAAGFEGVQVAVQGAAVVRAALRGEVVL